MTNNLITLDLDHEKALQAFKEARRLEKLQKRKQNRDAIVAKLSEFSDATHAQCVAILEAIEAGNIPFLKCDI